MPKTPVDWGSTVREFYDKDFGRFIDPGALRFGLPPRDRAREEAEQVAHLAAVKAVLVGRTISDVATADDDELCWVLDDELCLVLDNGLRVTICGGDGLMIEVNGQGIDEEQADGHDDGRPGLVGRSD